MKALNKSIIFITTCLLAGLTYSQNTYNFNYTGAEQTFTVPAGVHSLEIDAYGASGGLSTGVAHVQGYGGRVTTTLSVTPGQTLFIYVGGQGEGGTSVTSVANGGFNGGGNGAGYGSAGGGSSDIRINSNSINDRVVVAGGGGGHGDNYSSGDDGGHGGELIGENGYSNGVSTTDTSGTGGTQSSGGIGGQWQGTDPAEDGQFGQGGNGGFGAPTYAFSGGGGGGGGYYGGGGGSFAGGGGGSNYADPSVTSNTNHFRGEQLGNGSVIITEVCSTTPIPDVSSLPIVNSECPVLSIDPPTGSNCNGTFTGSSNVTFPISNTTTITWTYDDNGNTSTQTQEVIIDDVTAPVADVATLTDITDECEITSLTAPTATDNCVGSVTGNHNATLPITSTTTLTWTYDDGNGNTSTQTQEVIIDDVTAPVADVASIMDITDECEVTSLTAPTATDNCVGSVTGNHNATLPITSTTTITWTYDDGNGNTSTQTQEVIIDDVTAPVADIATLADLNEECEVTSLTAPTATDNCLGSVTGTHNATLPITATTTITWTYDDGNGNTSTQTQEVIIAPINNSVSVVDDITLSADASGYSYQWVDCDNNNSPISGETNQTFEATANGSYAVVIDNGDCSVTSDCFDITTVSLDKNEIVNINVYPNPTSGLVSITSSSKLEKVEVINVIGQIIYSSHINGVNGYKIELPKENGVYLIRVSNNSITKLFKIIKK